MLCACQTNEKVYKIALLQDSLKNFSEAIKLYEKAGAEGIAEAYYKLGNIYCDTVSSMTDSLKAFEYYKKADSLGVLEGSSQLGVLYFRAPKGIKGDTIKAIKLIEKAGDRNTASGYFAATLYHYIKYLNEGNSNGDSLKSTIYAENAMRLGFPRAFSFLAYEYAEKGNYKKAFYLFQKGIEKNDAYSIYEMGRILSIPEVAILYNIEPNGKKGIELLKRVVEKFPDAAVNIGWIYNYGFGVEKNEAKATYWFKKGADSGNAVGQYDYASQLYMGKGCNVNKKLALKYYRLSAKQGYPDAIKALKDLQF